MMSALIRNRRFYLCEQKTCQNHMLHKKQLRNIRETAIFMGTLGRMKIMDAMQDVLCGAEVS